METSSESCSWGESSSSEKWKTAFLVEAVGVGRRRGREPRETKAPGPDSSEKAERVRRCADRAPLMMDVVVDEEDEGTGERGVAYGIVEEGVVAGDCGSCRVI